MNYSSHQSQNQPLEINLRLNMDKIDSKENK